jgi:hypothetical protein
MTSEAAAGRRDWAWLLLALFPIAVAVARSTALPVSDSAIFEYVGRALVHGAKLYRDVWDDKLPSIYLVNALWQAAFGERYVLHTLAEAAINVATLWAFATLARGFGIRHWAPATFGFAVAYSVPLPLFNGVEHYAIALLLGGYVAAQRGRYVLAGIALALAATFWVPAALLIVPPLVTGADARRRGSLAAAFAVTLAAYGAAACLAVGTETVAGLERSWFVYVAASAVDTSGLHRLGPFSRTYAGLMLSGVLALTAALAAVAGKPRTEAQRFALWWFGCALLGGLAVGNGYAAYFLPSIPAVVLAIAAYAKRDVDLRRAVPLLIVALAAASRTLWWAHYTDDYARSQARDALAAGAQMRAALGDGAVFEIGSYAPQLFLAAHARPADRYGLLPPDLKAALRGNSDPIAARGLLRCQLAVTADPLYVERAAAARLGCRP